MTPSGRARSAIFQIFVLTCSISIKSTSTSDYGIPIEIKLWDSGRTPLAHMVDVTNGFGLKVLAEHNFLNENNIAFSPYGLMGILVALYEGVDGEASFQLQRAMGLPWNRNTMRIGFRDIHRTLKTYFVPEEGFLAGLALNNENVTFNEGYKKILRFYGYDLDSDKIPALTTTQSSIPASVTMTAMPDKSSPSESTTAMPTTQDMAAKEEPSTTTVAAETTTTTNAETTNEVAPETTPAASTAASTIAADQANIEMTMEPQQTTTPSVAVATSEAKTTSVPVTVVSTTTITTTTSAPEQTTVSSSTTTAANVETTINNEVEILTTASGSTPGTMSTMVASSDVTTVEASSLQTTAAMIDSTTTTPVASSLQTTAAMIDSTTTTPMASSPQTTAAMADSTTTTPETSSPQTTAVMTDITTTTPETSSPETTEAVTDSTTTVSEETSTQTIASMPETTTNNPSTLETLERRKKSIVDFIFTNPSYLDDYYFYKSYETPIPDIPLGGGGFSGGGGDMFLVNGLRNIQVTYMSYDTVLDHAYLPHLEASALRLPLDSERYYLLVVLPSSRSPIDLGRLLARMARESDLRDVHAALRPRRVRALVPSFMVKGHVTLTTDLQKLGIREVFEPRQRDFTPMTRQAGVYVRSIEQAVSVAIRKYREDVTKSNKYFANRLPVKFSATYPFLYFVMDSTIHVALMAGKMVDPLNNRIL